MKRIIIGVVGCGNGKLMKEVIALTMTSSNRTLPTGVILDKPNEIK